MMVDKNFLSPQSGRPCMGVVQDTLLGARLITMRSVFLEREQVMQILGFLKRWDGTIPHPAILKPRPLWTGKQIVSCILPPLNHSNYCLDFPASEKDQLILGNKAEDLSPTDSKLIIKKGEILCGHLCKKTVGAAHNSLIHILLKDYGNELNMEFIEDLQEITREYIKIRGFTIGNSDMPVEKDVRTKVKAAVKIIEDLMDKWKKEGIPIEEYETRVNKLTNDARGNVAKDLMSDPTVVGPDGKTKGKGLPLENNFRLILSAGSKGTSVNPTQIMVCGGQNTVEGKRIPYAFTNRVSPHVKQFDDRPVTRGFTINCLMNGLHPFEYWNYTMAGREGVVDTAVKTSETGYLQRRLTKAMEDLGVQYDGTVRNCYGTVILFTSGEDGFDGCFQEFHEYEPFKMGWQEFQEKYFWKDAKGLLEMEQIRLENDIHEMNQNKEIHKSYTSPVNFKRLLDNVPKGDCDLQPEDVVKDVIDLQIRLWKNIPQVDEKIVWDTKFAMLLRSILASKRIIQEFKLNSQGWKWLLEKIERNFVRGLAQPGDMVGAIAGQAIGEPSTQMTLNVFHFVGVSEKNIPLGVPRLKEIINNANKTKNPSLTIFLKKFLRNGRISELIKDGDAIPKLVSELNSTAQGKKQGQKEYLQRLDMILKPFTSCQVGNLVAAAKLVKELAEKLFEPNANPSIGKEIETVAETIPKLISIENKKFVTKFANKIKEKYLQDIIMMEEVIYDPDFHSTIITEDRELVEQFRKVPDVMDIKEGLEWTQYIIRLELAKEKMIEYDITMDSVIHSLRQIWDGTIYLEYSSEYSEKCIIRIRAIVEKKTKSAPGEDALLMSELLKYMRSNVLISGIEGIRKTFLKQVTSDDGGKEWVIETEGTNLRGMLANIYVDCKRTYSNDINEIKKVLGIEAATSSIIREITQVLKFYDIYVDYRHPCLLANLMCNREDIMGITRHGMNRTNSGPLIKASFEETSEVLHKGARYSQVDHLRGVSEALMVGTIPPIGTGKFSVYLNYDKLDLAHTAPEVVEAMEQEKSNILKPKQMERDVKERIFSKTVTTFDDLMRLDYEMDDLDLHMGSVKKESTGKESMKMTTTWSKFCIDKVPDIMDYSTTNEEGWRPPSPSDFI